MAPESPPDFDNPPSLPLDPKSRHSELLCRYCHVVYSGQLDSFLEHIIRKGRVG